MITDEEFFFFDSFAMHFLIQKYCHDRGHYFTWNIRLRIVALWTLGTQCLVRHEGYSCWNRVATILAGERLVLS